MQYKGDGHYGTKRVVRKIYQIIIPWSISWNNTFAIISTPENLRQHPIHLHKNNNYKELNIDMPSTAIVLVLLQLVKLSLAAMVEAEFMAT